MNKNVKQLNKNFKLNKRNLALTGCIAALMGCQSSPVNPQSQGPLDAPSLLISSQYNQQLDADLTAYHQQFANPDGVIADTQAKEFLLKSINRHLNSNHLSVSETRINSKPYVNAGSVDEGSNSIYDFIIDMAVDYFDKGSDLDYEDYSDIDENLEYDSYGDSFAGKPYITKEEYLENPAYVYYTYIDEQKNSDEQNSKSLAGTVATTDVVSRQIGFSSDYQDATNIIIEYTDEIDTCVNDLSYELDQLVAQKPQVGENSEIVSELMQTYSACKTEVTQNFSVDIANPIAYQQQYLTHANKCVSNYEWQLKDILSNKREISEIDYDRYDVIFESYDNCNDSLYSLNDLEPYNYTYEGWPKYVLDYRSQLVECNEVMLDQQDDLKANGITYGNNPQSYDNIYQENVECISAAEEQKAVSEDLALSSVSTISESSTSPKDEKEDTKETIKSLLAILENSPEQIKANNYYHNQYQTFTRISEFNATEKQINDIYSYQFASPTALYSVQVPISFDFKQSKITVDPSAFMPIVALADPENAPTLAEMKSTTVAFNLPDEINENLPPHVVYDSLIEAVSYSLSELDSSYFTVVGANKDDYAKEVGANTVVKVNLDGHQSGKLLGVIVKRMADNLTAYVDEHPEDFGNALKISMVLEKWKELNSNFQTNDVGAVVQIIQAVLPITFNKVNYYYLDSRGNLVAKQTRRSLGSDFTGSTSTFLSRTRYNRNRFNAHALNPLFLESFGVPFKNDSPVSMNGNEWFENRKSREDDLKLARMARQDYYTSDSEYGIGSESSINSCGIGEAQIEEYEPEIAIVDYGNVNDEEYEDGGYSEEQYNLNDRDDILEDQQY